MSDCRDTNTREGNTKHASPQSHDRQRRLKLLYLLSIFPCPLKTVARMELVCHQRKKMTNCFQFEMNSALTDCYAAHGWQEQVRNQNRVWQGQLLRERIAGWFGKNLLAKTPRRDSDTSTCHPAKLHHVPWPWVTVLIFSYEMVVPQ